MILFGGDILYKTGQIVSREEVESYIKSLAEIDEDMFEIYTKIFSEYVCDIVKLSDLDYSRINREEEFEIIEQYKNDIKNMPPIVVSPSFDGKRIVYDGCHRCVALENLGVQEVVALIPYKTIDGRMVEDLEENKPELNKCKYTTIDNTECNKGKCCFCCDKGNNCGGICNYCHDIGTLRRIIGKNVSLFCDGVW